MNAPTLLVGLGGTGSKIVCRVANMVQDMVPVEQQQRIGFAVFDTDINELREIQDANPFVHTIQTSTKLSVGEYLNIDTHARDTWFPVNAILNSKTLTEGAGQVRAISRLALETAIRAGNMEPLHTAIEDLYKLEEEHSDQALRVIIVSSLAGGTGSGLILPVALYIKNFLKTRFQQSANITRGFFILPEVFYQVIRGESERNNLRCNAYATLRELDAFLMKGDSTLPDKYADTVKYEFPRVGSNEFEEYNVRPYDFCFLFDAQNTEGKKLNNFNQYLDHAATCIYSQSIGPMNKRSNSSEDNTIRELCAESGRNRYAGAGSSMLFYPVEDVKTYLALNWTKQSVSDQWLVFDRIYKDKCIANAEQRSMGYSVKDTDPSKDYIDQVEQMSKNRDPFAKSIVTQCTRYDESGLIEEGKAWEEYIGKLRLFVKASVSHGQPDIDSQETKVKTMVSEIEGDADVWQNFLDTYREMKKLLAMVERRSEDSARTIAYSIFKAKNDSITKDKYDYQLETYLRDSAGKFIHPNAVRYFLYQALELMKNEKIRVEKKIKDEEKYFENFVQIFDNAKTEEVETEDQLTDRKVAILNRLKKLTGDQQDMKAQYLTYVQKVEDYRVDGILASVYEEGISYIDDLCSAFQTFYNSFESKINEVEKKINTIAKKYNHTTGKTARYVCATKTCLDKMVQTMPYTGNTVSIDGKLAENIYSKVRNYSMMKEKSENNNYFDEIFENGIIDYFKNRLMDSYSSDINMDVLDALEKEARYEFHEFDERKIEQYVRHVISDTRKLANPFIERPLGENKESISACTYSKKLDPKDDSPRSNLIEEELGNFGGSPDEDIPLGMIMFYESIYGLRANRLSKFAPADATGRQEGEYFKAYYELVSQIKPTTDKTPVITPHIDRRWHIVSFMPDLDEKNQKKQEAKIYRAFMYGFALDMIRYDKIDKGKHLYRLHLKDCDTESFVVSNGTPCDNFYEVLDALTINPVVVNRILEQAERIFKKERDKTSKVMFDSSILKSELDILELEEFGCENISLFDIATLLKVSTPAAEFDKTVGKDLLKVMFNEIYQYMGTMTKDDKLNRLFGEYVKEQYLKYDSNTNWYLEQFDDNYIEYIDDMVTVAVEMLEDMEIDEVKFEIKKLQKQANKARN